MQTTCRNAVHHGIRTGSNNANGYFGQQCMVTFRSIANFYVCSLDQYMNTSSCLKEVKGLFSVSDKTYIYHPSQNMTVAELSVVLWLFIRFVH